MNYEGLQIIIDLLNYQLFLFFIILEGKKSEYLYLQMMWFWYIKPLKLYQETPTPDNDFFLLLTFIYLFIDWLIYLSYFLFIYFYKSGH